MKSIINPASSETSPYRDPQTLPKRRSLGHHVPAWVSVGETFFVTVCAQNRGSRPLVEGDTASKLIDTVKFLHDRGDWFARLFLVMSDHVHGLFGLPSTTSLARRFASWKSYTHKVCGIEWQERFFDHRLRSDESLDEKALYIRMNPVRSGLVATPSGWPHLFDAFAIDGTAGTPRPT